MLTFNQFILESDQNFESNRMKHNLKILPAGKEQERWMTNSQIKPEHQDWIDKAEQKSHHVESTIDVDHETKSAYINRIDAFRE
jgi:hypothetical protein